MHLRRPILLLLLLALSASAAPASAAVRQDRIINGTDASPGEYPAQGFLGLDTDGDGVFDGACGGTLVGPRRFLTAAHCSVDDSGNPFAPSVFQAWIGQTDLNDVTLADVYDVSAVSVHEHYAEDAARSGDDVAMLTLARPSSLPPLRIVRPDETALWAPGDVATIIGWGATSEGGSSSDVLQAAQVPIVGDASCRDDYLAATPPIAIDPDTMVCAADSSDPRHDTCQGDSGGPLMVEDGAAQLILAGVVSFGIGSARPEFPGIYARIGAPALNAWVRGRRSGVDFTRTPPTPTAGQPAAFTAAGDGSEPRWDFDGDGTFEAAGAVVDHTFGAPGPHTVTLRETDPEGQPAEREHTVPVGAAPNTGPGTGTSGGGSGTGAGTGSTGTPAPPLLPPVLSVPPVRLATLIVGRNAPVDRRGRFGIRINFSALAPAGKRALVTVRKGRAKLGSAKVKVARGKSVQAKVKLTKSALRRLRKAKKLRVTVRVALGSSVQVKKVTLRAPRARR